MNRKTLGLIVAVVLLVNASFLVYYRVKGHKSKHAAPAAPGQTSGLICPECKQPLKYEGADCGFCAYKKRVGGPTRAVDTPQPALSAIGKLAISTGVLSSLLVFLYWPQIRRFLSRVKPVPSLVIRCGKCKRKLKYLVSSAGRDGLCPGCGVKFTFPHLTSSGIPPKTTIKEPSGQSL